MPDTPLSIKKNTAARLKKYGLFSDKTINAVSLVAEKQAAYTSYREYFKDVGITGTTLHVTEKGSGVPVVDIAPKVFKKFRKSQSSTVLVVHLPMSNPLDGNQLYCIATLASLFPERRIVGFGNPSGGRYNFSQQNLTFLKRLKIAFTKNSYPLVEAELDYLRTQNIATAYHIGYSYGAAKALFFSKYATQGAIIGALCIDPATHPRSIRQLIRDFKETLLPLGKYVNRTKITTYFEARRDAAKEHYHKNGLKRQINIAIGLAVARLDFIPLLKAVLIRHPAMKVAVAWGSKSELGDDAYMTTELNQVKTDMPGRVQPFRLEGDTHALANDIHLYGALVYESLNKDS